MVMRFSFVPDCEGQCALLAAFDEFGGKRIFGSETNLANGRFDCVDQVPLLRFRNSRNRPLTISGCSC